MGNLIKLGLIFLTALAAVSCASNRSISGQGSSVTPVSPGRVLSEGSLVYALPLTVFNIEMEAERVIEIPGPYSRFAEDLLGLTDIIKSENEYWTITGINLITHEEPDPAQFYAIEASSMFPASVLSLRKAGLILDLNPDIYRSGNDIYRLNDNGPETTGTYDLGADEYFQEKKDTLYRVVKLDTAFVRIPYLVEKRQKLTIDKLAERAAIRLMELRDGKHLILTGETNLFPQNEAAIREMNRLEKEYTELFTGKSVAEKKKFSYQIIPGIETAGKPVVLCRYSESTGMAGPDDISGTPVTIEFIPEMRTRVLKMISYAPETSRGIKYDKLYFRVPDVVSIRISVGNKVMSTSRNLVYQFGEIVRLPANYIIGM